MAINGESMAKRLSLRPNTQGTTTDALTNMTRDAEQQNMFKEFKKIHLFTRPHTMATTLAECVKPLR
uniref:Uncharacterized protein n=1 Tax=Lotus japonicus TaxID=34305 RepID=I3SR41_LOTJA|nr:unknown [Lotus japonicus]